MDKKIAGLLAAAAALTTIGASAATPAATEPVGVTSYHDLLEPVPNALEALKADDARLAQATAGSIEQVQYRYRDHHHHHHQYRRRFVPPPFRRDHHHHHHHHHHSTYYRG